MLVSDYLVVHIFGFLDVPSTLNSALVARKWHELSKHNFIWRDLYYQTFCGGTMFPEDCLSKQVNWQEHFRKAWIIKHSKEAFAFSEQDIMNTITSSGHTASLVGDNIFVFGGLAGINHVKHLRMFDVPHLRWTRHSKSQHQPSRFVLPHHPSPYQSNSFLLRRWLHTATVMKNTLIYIIGGQKDWTFLCVSNIKVLDTQTCEWKSLEAKLSSPCKRAGKLIPFTHPKLCPIHILRAFLLHVII